MKISTHTLTLQPKAEMLGAVQDTLRLLERSGTPPAGVALVVWHQVAGHIALLLEEQLQERPQLIGLVVSKPSANG